VLHRQKIPIVSIRCHYHSSCLKTTKRTPVNCLVWHVTRNFRANKGSTKPKTTPSFLSIAQPRRNKCVRGPRLVCFVLLDFAGSLGPGDTSASSSSDRSGDLDTYEDENIDDKIRGETVPLAALGSKVKLGGLGNSCWRIWYLKIHFLSFFLRC